MPSKVPLSAGQSAKKLRDEIEERKAREEAEKARATNLENRSQSLNNELDYINQQLRNELEEKDKLSQQKRSIEDEIEEIKVQREKVQESCSIIGLQLKKRDEELEEAKKKLEAEQALNTSTNSEIRNMAKEVDAYKSGYEDERRKAIELEQCKGGLESVIARLRSKVEKLNTELAESEKEKEVLERTLQEARTTLPDETTSTGDHVQQLTGEYLEATKALEVERLQVEQTEKSNKMLAEQLEETSARLQEEYKAKLNFDQSNKSLHNEVALLKDKLQAKEEEMGSLLEEKRASIVQVEDLQNKLEKAGQTLEAINGTSAEILLDNQGLRDKCYQSTNTYLSLTKKVKSIEPELENLGIRLENERKGRQEAEQEAQEVRSVLRDLRKKFGLPVESYTSSGEDSECQELEERIDLVESEKRKSEFESARKQSEIDDLTLALQAAEKEIVQRLAKSGSIDKK